MSELHVVFGTGPIGRYTAYTLLEKGLRVRMVNRSGVMHDKPDDVELITSDACDTAQNTVITRGATSVYFCVAPAYTEWASTFSSLQQAVLDAAIANQTRLVVVENLYGYGAFQGTLREDSPSNPSSRKGQVRLAMQRQLGCILLITSIYKRRQGILGKHHYQHGLRQKISQSHLQVKIMLLILP